MASAHRVEIPGCQRELDPRHPRVGEVDGDKQVEVTVYLRSSASLAWADQEAGRRPSERQTLSREELASGYGAKAEDIDAMRSFVGEYGLEVSAVDQGRRSVSLRGTVNAVAAAFGAHGLGQFKGATDVSVGEVRDTVAG